MLEKLIAAILAGIKIKKPLYWLFAWKKDSPTGKPFWECKNPAGNSARRCKKALAEYVKNGWPRNCLTILPLGIKPDWTPEEQN